jgi:hypothetical protein
VPARTVGAGPFLRYRFGRDDVEDALVDRLPDVDPAVELGAFLSLGTPVTIFGVEDPTLLSGRVALAQDVADGHGGLVGEISAGFTRPVTERFRLAGGVSATWSSEDYMEAYFGVTPAGSAASGLPVFSPGAALSFVGVNLAGTYSITESWSVSLIGGVGTLLGDAADSPVVADRGSEV